MKHLIPILACAACTDVPQPFELDHTRVMAVRVDPPALASGEVARVDVLVTSAEAGPRVATPTEVSIAPIVGVDIERDATGWYVVAPDGVTAIVPLSITVESEDGPLSIQKTLAFGSHADNPRVPVIAIDGVDTDASRTAELAGTDDRVLSVAATNEDLSYRWFSSIGELVGYTRPTATLEPSGGPGHLALVVRDQAGGTAWTLLTARVTP